MSTVVKPIQRRLIKLVPSGQRLTLTQWTARQTDRWSSRNARRQAVARQHPLQERERLLTGIIACFDSAGCEYFRIPDHRYNHTQLGVLPENHDTFVSSVLPALRTAELRVTRWPCENGQAWSISLPKSNHRCIVALWNSNGEAMVSPVQNSLAVKRSEGPLLVQGEERDFSWLYDDAADGRKYPTFPSLIAPDTFSIRFPIDVVYTWVDGSDPDWNDRKNRALEKLGRSPSKLSSNDSRFANRDELKYSMRSLFAFAPWVRHVYLVTDDQVPSWLDESSSRITVVSHREIFRDVGVDHSFNSQAIETRLHHIPGLSEQFLYFNDDVLLARPTSPSKFFTATGMTHFFPSPARINGMPVNDHDIPVDQAAKNNRRILMDRFGSVNRQKMKHTPHALNKEVLREIEAEYPDRLRETATQPFRHPSDISLTSSLHHYWAYLTQRATPGHARLFYAGLEQASTPTRLREFLKGASYDFLCLNDADSDGIAPDLLHEVCQSFFERFLPEPSPVEKRND